MIDVFVPRPSESLVRRVIAAGADAGRVALEAGHRAIAGGVSDVAVRMKAATDATADDLAERVVRAHLLLARSEGAAAGVLTSTAEATTIVGSAGVLTVPAAVVITVTDLTGLAWIQLRMVLLIAALYGHDPMDAARLQEFMSLQASGTAVAPVVVVPLSDGARRVLTRLLMRHLRGPVLASITSLFRVVGIKFARAALLRQLFLVNIPVNVLVNDIATRRLAQKARIFYRTLPPSY